MNNDDADLFNGPLPPMAGEPSARDLAWLAGFTDGEGTITLNVATHRTGIRTITPRYSLSNTNLPNLGRARVLLAKLTGHDVKIETKKNDGRSRPAYSIRVSSHFDVDVTVRALYQYLVGRQRQAFVVLQYLAIAPGHPSHPDGFARARGRRPEPNAHYDSRHWELVTEIRRLNRRYGPGEWQTMNPDPVSLSPAIPPGADDEPMDPLKRWYRLYVG